MHCFTPLASVVGRTLIALSASAMLGLDGKIAGISVRRSVFSVPQAQCRSLVARSRPAKTFLFNSHADTSAGTHAALGSRAQA